jgi:hypothetical protein
MVLRVADESSERPNEQPTEWRMSWSSDTTTTVVAAGNKVVLTDIGERLAQGHAAKTMTVEEAMDLADQHDICGALLRRAARQAWANQQNAKG